MPTALELSRKGWKRYVQAASRRRRSDEDLKEQAARALLLKCVREAAEMLKARFSVRRVVLFGSLAHTVWFIPDSDVDLAVEGLAPRDYWLAWRAVEEIIRDRPVDLIEIETASEPLRQAIERYGIQL